MKKLPKTLTTVTWFSKFLAIMMFFTFILAGVYFGMRYQHLIDSGTMSVPDSSNSYQNSIIISPDQNNKIISAKVGEYISFKFGNNQKWTFSFSDNSLISGSGTDYKLIKPGTLDITGTGVANCKRGEMCPMFAIYFKSTVNIK